MTDTRERPCPHGPVRSCSAVSVDDVPLQAVRESCSGTCARPRTPIGPPPGRARWVERAIRTWPNTFASAVTPGRRRSPGIRVASAGSARGSVRTMESPSNLRRKVTALVNPNPGRTPCAGPSGADPSIQMIPAVSTAAPWPVRWTTAPSDGVDGVRAGSGGAAGGGVGRGAAGCSPRCGRWRPAASACASPPRPGPADALAATSPYDRVPVGDPALLPTVGRPCSHAPWRPRACGVWAAGTRTAEVCRARGRWAGPRTRACRAGPRPRRVRHRRVWRSSQAVTRSRTRSPSVSCRSSW
ncbi:hypothetical protein SUDANB121_00932 [Nocardiopsis dassonvillei]